MPELVLNIGAARTAASRLAGLVLCSLLLPAPAAAQLRYGPWQVQSSTCEAQRIIGPFGNGPISPQVPGTTPFQTCNYCRAVEECPRLRDKLLNPKQCFTKRQCRRASNGPPQD